MSEEKFKCPSCGWGHSGDCLECAYRVIEVVEDQRDAAQAQLAAAQAEVERLRVQNENLAANCARYQEESEYLGSERDAMTDAGVKLQAELSQLKHDWNTQARFWNLQTEKDSARIREASAMLRRLINKVNPVTAEWRHHGTTGKVYAEAMWELCARQVEAEQFLEGLRAEPPTPKGPND